MKPFCKEKKIASTRHESKSDSGKIKLPDSMQNSILDYNINNAIKNVRFMNIMRTQFKQISSNKYLERSEFYSKYRFQHVICNIFCYIFVLHNANGISLLFIPKTDLKCNDAKKYFYF